MKKFRHWLYQVLETHNYGFLGKVINVSLMVIILLNVVVIIASSESEIDQRFHLVFKIFEIFSLIVFTIEYLLRVWVSVEEGNKENRPLSQRLKYMLKPMALIDLLAIAPSYILLFGSEDLLVLRTLRLIRIFKLTRYSRSMELLVSVAKQEAETMISAIFILSIMIIIAATGIHLVEGDIQPDEFGSIPRALWWATVTLTTVGYGDVVPITSLGRVLGIIIVIVGIGMAALPAGILASGFTTELNRRRERFKTKILPRIKEGKLPKKERKKIEKIRKELGISHADAGLMIVEARQEAQMASHIDCPHCGNNIHIRHSAGDVSLEKESRKEKTAP